MTTATLNRNPILDAARISHDPSDPYGWSGAWGFGIGAIAWELTGGDVPDAWGYHPGNGNDHPIDDTQYEEFEILSALGLEYEDEALTGTSAALEAAGALLVNAGNFFVKYAGQCRLAGLDY